jgi:hypothetical protein
MTWIVGANTFFGYGVAVSDICVTTDGGVRHDLLRKVYPVGRFLVAGFAGSVRIGFDMIEDLKSCLQMHEGEEELCWQPEWVAENWPPRARRVFSQQNRAEQQCGSEVILLGMEPSESAMRGGNPVMATFCEPDFEPSITTKTNEIASIGSGAGQQEAMELLSATLKDHELMKAEVNNYGGFGKLIGSSMTRMLFFDPPNGISRHLHICTVGVDRIELVTNDTIRWPKDAEPQTLRMPKVANSYTEMCAMLNANAAEASGVRAVVAAQTLKHANHALLGFDR